MPLMWNNKIVQDIYVGRRQSREIYQGRDLAHKKYTITFHNITENSSEDGTWGIVPSITPPEISESYKQYLQDFAEYNTTAGFDDYTYTFKGWYTDKALTSPAGTYSANNKNDIELYSKWVLNFRQKKYYYYIVKLRKVITTYSVTSTGKVTVLSVTKSKTSSSGTNSGGYPESADITVSDWQQSHPNYYLYGDTYTGQCTWYANGRTAELHNGHGAPWGSSSWPNAYSFADVDNAYWVGSNVRDLGTPNIGDCASWLNKNGSTDPDDWSFHVGVIESISGSTAIISHWNSTKDGKFTLTSNKPASWTLGSDFWGMSFYGYCYYVGGTSQSGESTSASGSTTITRTKTKATVYTETSYEEYYVYKETDWCWVQPTDITNVYNTEYKDWYSVYNYQTNQWNDFSLVEP